MDNDFDNDLRELTETIEEHDVIALHVMTAGWVLLLDFRAKEAAGPMVRVVQPVTTPEERYERLQELRPDFEEPESIAVVPWPRFARSLGDSEFWTTIADRLNATGGEAAVGEARAELAAMTRLEAENQQNAIRGEGFQTLWSAEDSPR